MPRRRLTVDKILSTARHGLMLEFGHDKKNGYWLRAEMFVEHPLETVFDFFADAKQLERITPSTLNFKILTPMPVEMKAGLLLDYQISIHKIPIKWRTEIAVWEPPYRFIDRQLKGPYRLWHHEHTFEETENGTLVKDRVLYKPCLLYTSPSPRDRG